MKKNIMRMAAVLSAVMISAAGMAQEAESVAPAPQRQYVKNIYAKLGVGAGMYYDYNGYFDQFEPAFSPVAGIAIDKYPTLNGFGYNITLEFTNKSSCEDDDKLKSKVRYSIPCISLPVRATYNWYSPKHTLRWQAGVGAFAAFNIDHKEHYDGETFDLDKNSTSFRDFDAGLAFSFGCHFKQRWYLGMEWENGLVPIASSKYEKHTAPTTTTGHFVVGFKL